VIATPQLTYRVPEHRPEYDHAVSCTTARPRQIDDQGPVRDTNDTTAQHRCWHTMISTVSSDRCCQLRNLALHHGTRLLRSVIMRIQAGAPSRDHYGMTGRHGLPQSDADWIPVGDDHWAFYSESKIIKRSRDDRP
jgi:hypothetical protein